jgi:hypothetical protein
MDGSVAAHSKTAIVLEQQAHESKTPRCSSSTPHGVSVQLELKYLFFSKTMGPHIAVELKHPLTRNTCFLYEDHQHDTLYWNTCLSYMYMKTINMTHYIAYLIPSLINVGTSVNIVTRIHIQKQSKALNHEYLISYSNFK